MTEQSDTGYIDDVADLEDLTPVTFQILGMIAKKEQIKLSGVLERILTKKPFEISLSIAATIFILIYLDCQTKIKHLEAYEAAGKIVERSTTETEFLLKRIFVDERISLEAVKKRLGDADIANHDDFISFLKEVISNNTSHMH